VDKHSRKYFVGQKEFFDLNKEQNSEKFISSVGLISFLPKGAKKS